jgi:hypothetical protein
MDEGTLLVAVVGASGTMLGASIALIGTARAARYAMKTAQITAENEARMQSEKLRHDARLGESAFRRGKLEELCLSVERATAYYTLSRAVLRRPDAPILSQQSERYAEDMDNILRARVIAGLYFDNLTETINNLIGLISSSVHTHREYFRVDTKQPPDALERWTGEIMKLADELFEIKAELYKKIGENTMWSEP